MWLTVLLLGIHCSSGCSSWLDHILLLCSLKVESRCLLSPLLMAFPDIIHRAIKVSGALSLILCPQWPLDCPGQCVRRVTVSSVSSQVTHVHAEPIRPPRNARLVHFASDSFCTCFPMFVLASTDYSCFLFASLSASFLAFFSCSLSCTFFCFVLAIKTKKLVLKALSDQ